MRKFSVKLIYIFLTVLFVTVGLFLFRFQEIWAGDIGNSSGYTWSEKAGFIHFSGADATPDYGVTVSDSGLSGYAWGEKTGYIRMHGEIDTCIQPGGGCPTGYTYGVANDGNGNLSGFGWSEKGGWIKFSGTADDLSTYQVTIDSAGNFDGYAWGEKIGWIHFKYSGVYSYGVTTNWKDTGLPTNPAADSGSGYSVEGGDSLTSGNWYAHTAPYFTYPTGTDPDPGGAGEQPPSGIAGYYVYFGTNASAVPKDDGSWSAGNTAVDRVYQSGTLTSTDTYYLRVQAKDNAGNEASSGTTVFTYKFDNTLPSGLDFVSVSPQGYASTNEFTFVWPQATDVHSGLAGYCYKTGDPAFPDEALCGGDGKFITQTTISTDDDPNWVKAYQDGENIFYVRSKDIAGNYPSWVQTTYYFSGTAPSPPQNLQVTPQTTEDSPSTNNSFAFSWEKPVSYTGDIKGYYYSVNSEPTQDNSTFTTSTSLASGSFATSQGKNTFYIVAQDTAENINWDAYISVDFYCETSAPPIPTGVNIADSSNREEKKYALTITWTKPSGLDENTFSHYVIERAIDSANSEDFSDIAHTEALGYLDTGLDTAKTYYYRIRTCDNAGSCSSPSSVVYLKPTGRYTTPPEISEVYSESNVLGYGEKQKVQIIVAWKTNEPASSKVFYGEGVTGEFSGETEEFGDLVLEHLVVVSDLKPSKIYHFKVESFDKARNSSISEIFTVLTSRKRESFLQIIVGVLEDTFSWVRNIRF